MYLSMYSHSVANVAILHYLHPIPIPVAFLQQAKVHAKIRQVFLVVYRSFHCTIGYHHLISFPVFFMSSAPHLCELIFLCLISNTCHRQSTDTYVSNPVVCNLTGPLLIRVLCAGWPDWWWPGCYETRCFHHNTPKQLIWQALPVPQYYVMSDLKVIQPCFH